MRAFWIMLLTPTLILSIPVDKSPIDTNKRAPVPGPNHAKPYINTPWSQFPSSQDVHSKIDEGLSSIITEVGGVMNAMSNIFDIFGPTRKINTKSYGNSPGADEVEFIAPKNKTSGCKDGENCKGETITDRVTTETADGEETTPTEPPVMESMSDRRANL